VVVLLAGTGVEEVVDGLVEEAVDEGVDEVVEEAEDELADDGVPDGEVAGLVAAELSVPLVHPTNASAARTRLTRRTRTACRSKRNARLQSWKNSRRH